MWLITDDEDTWGDRYAIRRYIIYNLLTDKYKRKFDERIKKYKDEHKKYKKNMEHLLKFLDKKCNDVSDNDIKEKYRQSYLNHKFYLGINNASYESAMYDYIINFYCDQQRELGEKMLDEKAIGDFMRKVKGIYSD